MNWKNLLSEPETIIALWMVLLLGITALFVFRICFAIIGQ